MNANRPALRPAVFALLVIALMAAGILPAAGQASPTSTPMPAAGQASPTPTPMPAAGQASPTPTPMPAAQATPTSTPLPLASGQFPPFPAVAATLEFVGLVEAVDAGTLTVSGQVVDTRLAGVRGNPAVGSAVKIEGLLGASGQMVAREVDGIDLARSDKRPGDVELVGALTAMTQNRLTIAGIPMDAANAEFGPGVGIGQIVEIEGTLTAPNQWIIREIELASADDAAELSAYQTGEFEITGIVSEIGPDYIVVNGLRINTTNAEIDGVIAVGALVEVHMSFINGQWVAREVDLEDDSDNFDDDSDDHDDDDDHNDDHDDDDDHNDDHDDHNDDHDDDHDEDDD